MRIVILLTIAALAASEVSDEPLVEEEDLEEYYNDYNEAEQNSRDKRDVYTPENTRVKRFDKRSKRSEYVRNPRQVHQYEVHEAFEESSIPSPPYEEMLAASAEHYHKVYAAPNTRARYVNAGVSPGPLTFGVQPSHPIQIVTTPVIASPQLANNHPTELNPLAANIQHNVEVPSIPLYSVASYQHQTNPVVSNNEPINIAPILTASEDSSVAAGHHQNTHQPYSHGHAQGAGRQHQSAHHSNQGEKTSKGFANNHHVDKGGKGHKTDDLHRKEYEEAVGQKKKHHDHADHKGSHEEQAHGHRGSKFDEKKGHKKGHKTKGFHNKYHKDEFHKEHKFYDDYHKSGEHHRYGKFNAKHASDEGGKKKAHHVNAGHDVVQRGKKGYSNKGHVDADHKGYRGKHGHEEHHENHSQHGKKGGKEGGSHWGYAKKN